MRKKLSMLLGLLLVCSLTVGLINVTPVNAAAKVKLNATKKTLYVGEEFQLELANAKGAVKWTTSSKKKATVKDGLVKAVATGKVTIKAKDQTTGKTYKCKITIKKNAISNKTLSIKVGESYGLTLKGNTSAEWTSSDESVAYVSSGTVTAIKKGKATITAKVGTKKYTCKVTVSANEAIPDEPIELTMWYLGDNESHSFEQAVADLAAAYPTVKLNYKFYENETYKEKIKAALAAGELPDIFYTWSGSFLGDFADAGAVYCLDDVMAKYIASGDITKVMLENSSYNGKTYGVPLSMNIVTVFVNTELLKEAGVKDVPKTYDELIACCDKLVEKGITPFGCAGEPWCVSEYLESIIEKNIGADALKAIFAGEATFNNKGIAEAVDLLIGMIMKGYFNVDDLFLHNYEITEKFVNGEFAFYINGSWNCGYFANEPDFGDKVAVTEFPVINPKNSKSGELIGGPSNTLAVSAKSKNAYIAAEYAAALGKLISMYSYLDGEGLPTWKISYSDNEVNDLTKQVAKMCEKASAYVLFGDTAIDAQYVPTYLEYISKLLTGTINGDAFIKGLAKDIK